eukprot:jgi/Ulvmu1/4061/UM019_0039.1
MPAEEMRNVEKLLIQKFNAEARPLSSGALHSLAAFVVESKQSATQIVQDLLSQLTVGENPTITAGDIDTLIRRVEEQDGKDDLIQVLNVFRMPRIEWDAAQNRFVRCSARPSMHPGPLSKPAVVLRRLQMVQQTVLRGEKFRGRSLASTPSSSLQQLTQVKGLVGTAGNARLVLGMLRKDVKGRTLLEDASGVVPVTGLHQADTTAVQGFLCEGACALVSGKMQPSGVFHASSISEPPVEAREGAVASLRGLNISGARPLRPGVIREVKEQNYADEAKRLVFLSGCFLDDPLTLRAITAIFHGYEHLEEGPPAVFVFIGPFFRPQQRAAPTDSHSMRTAFHAMANAISLFPSIQSTSKMVFVPAATDSGDFGVLPQRPLLPSVIEPLTSSTVDVTFASNPCRIHFYTKQVLIFASPCVQALQERNMLQQPRETDLQEVFRRACHTALSQRHLAPLPQTVQPVHWEYDGTLAIFPQPHALVMPLSGLMYSMDMHGVRCICPGSVDLGTFVAYIPSAPRDADEADDSAAGSGEGGVQDESKKTNPEPPEALVEECEVPLAAGEAADSDAASDTSADAPAQLDEEIGLEVIDPLDHADDMDDSEDDFLADVRTPRASGDKETGDDDVSMNTEDA